jgi:hypothetical protein
VLEKVGLTYEGDYVHDDHLTALFRKRLD